MAIEDLNEAAADEGKIPTPFEVGIHQNCLDAAFPTAVREYHGISPRKVHVSTRDMAQNSAVMWAAAIRDLKSMRRYLSENEEAFEVLSAAIESFKAKFAMYPEEVQERARARVRTTLLAQQLAKELDPATEIHRSWSE